LKHRKIYLLKSIFIKFVLAFIFVGLFPLMAIGYYIFEQLPQDLEKDIISNYNQMLLFTSKNIEMKIGEYNQISQLVYNYQSGRYSTISEILKANQFQLMEDFLKSTVYSDRYIESAFFLDEGLDIYSHFTQNAYPLDENFKLSSYPKTNLIMSNKKKLTILPTHEEDYYFRSDNQVISFVRNYLDIHLLPDVEKVITVFLIEVNTDFIKSILDPISIGEESNIIIIDNSGNPIYQSSEKKSDFSIGEMFKQVRGPAEDFVAGFLTAKKGYLFYRNVAKTDWILIFEIPHSDIYRLVNENKKLGLIVIAFLLLCLLLLAFAFSKKLSQPIKNIIAQMKLVESGNFNSDVTVKTHDEIFLLAQAFNRMVKELNVHINEAYVAQIKQKEAELNAIKTQIRPPFSL
jgi:two-component system sensor histidine kinase YesM